MPDVQEASPSLDSLAGGLPGSDDPLKAKVASLGRAEIAEKDKVYRSTTETMHADKATADRAFEGISNVPDEKWDSDAERQKRIRSPIEDFGSIGSIFAVMASAFTHQPMINALNGAASSMNSLRAADEKGYEDAFSAWKTNTDLALKRHQVQREAFDDALKKFKTDQGAGAVELEMVAKRFGDKKAQAFIEAGMLPELIDYKQKEAEAAVKLGQYRDQITESTLRRQALEGDPGWTNEDPDPVKKAGYRLDAFNRVYNATKQTPQQQLMAKWFHEHPTGTVEEAAEFADKHGIIRQFGTGGGNSSTTSAEVMRRAKGYEEDPDSPTFGDHPASYDRAMREVKQAAAPPITGNRRNQLEGHIAQYDVAIEKIDKVTAVLDKYVGAAGVAGKATRLGERLSNIGGSNSTDRVQMMRDISELQLLAPRLLLDQSTGRPLSVEAGHINDIIAGLSPGDTTANTQRAMKELRKDMEKLRDQNKARIAPSGEKPKAEEEKPADNTDWLNQYPVKK